jgi:hypothetical protein
MRTPGVSAALWIPPFWLSMQPAPVLAQNGASEPNVPEKAGKDLHAYHLHGQPPRIDGRLDDEVWTLAQTIDDFVQNEPDNMAPPRDRTSVQVAFVDRRSSSPPGGAYIRASGATRGKAGRCF